jgi:hypothetical protein
MKSPEFTVETAFVFGAMLAVNVRLSCKQANSSALNPYLLPPKPAPVVGMRIASEPAN